MNHQLPRRSAKSSSVNSIEPLKVPIQDLCQVELFAKLRNDELAEVLAAGRKTKRERGMTFFRQGDMVDRFFVVHSGRVKLMQSTEDGQQLVLRHAGAGQIFGGVAGFGSKIYPAAAIAVVNTEAWCWDHQTFVRLMERFPPIALNALELLGQEIELLRARYRELVTERVERRIARTLLRLVRQAGRQVDAGVLIEFPLSRQDLAELTGTTLHTVSRILSDWECKGLIRSGRRRVTLCKPHEIVTIAEDLIPPSKSTDAPKSGKRAKRSKSQN